MNLIVKTGDYVKPSEVKYVRRQNIPDSLLPDLRDTSAHQGCSLSRLS
jgi:hypothetical protein